MTTFNDLEQRLSHEFARKELLARALTHRSYHFENKDKSPGHFERLEFLGDAVLDLILSEILMEKYPEVEEGTLSKWRASLVNEQTLSAIARSLGLGKHLFLGRSESQNREVSEGRPRLLASAFEAVVAALYQDAGLEATRAFIEREFQTLMDQLNPENEFATDFKTRLQEWAQKNLRCLPEYRFVESQGPEHAKIFVFEVTFSDELYGRGEGSSRKAAEQDAAQAALKKIGENV